MTAINFEEYLNSYGFYRVEIIEVDRMITFNASFEDKEMLNLPLLPDDEKVIKMLFDTELMDFFSSESFFAGVHRGYFSVNYDCDNSFFDKMLTERLTDRFPLNWDKKEFIKTIKKHNFTLDDIKKALLNLYALAAEFIDSLHTEKMIAVLFSYTINIGINES